MLVLVRENHWFYVWLWTANVENDIGAVKCAVC